VQAHHIKFWAEGGATKLNNLCHVCHFHHALVHDGDYRVEMLADGKFRFTDPSGWVIPEVPLPMEPPDEPLTDIELDGSEGGSEWGGAPINIEYLLDTTWRPRISPE